MFSSLSLPLYTQGCPGEGVVSATVGRSSHLSRQCPANVPTGHPALDTETPSPGDSRLSG